MIETQRTRGGRDREGDRSIAAGTEEFSAPLFLVTIGLTLAGLLILLRVIAPEMWRLQIAASWLSFVGAFVVLSLLICFRRRERKAVNRSTVSTRRAPSPGEETANWVTHGAGAVLSAAALPLLIVMARDLGDKWHLVGFTDYGMSLVGLYAMSTLYHLSRDERARGIFRRLDHAAIFVLIAGTYTPFLLTHLRGPLGWTLFCVIWTLCGTGAVLQYFFAGRYRLVSTLGYLAAGWLILTAMNPLFREVPRAGVWLLVGGGILYTAGVPFYLWRRLRYHHAIWHGFVLGGSACHFLAVLKCLNVHA